MLSFSTVDNQHRQSFVATSLDEGFCEWATEMKRVSALQFDVGRTLGALATLTITDAHKSSSEVYGKIEGFTSPAV
jgi:hypothetical protein